MILVGLMVFNMIEKITKNFEQFAKIKYNSLFYEMLLFYENFL